MSDRAEIKKTLLARKQVLEDELSRLSREKFSDEQIADPADQAAVSTMEDLNVSLQNNERVEYEMIMKALQMIDEGTYGICSDCGNAISEKRLQLYPNATRCLACQEVSEERK